MLRIPSIALLLCFIAVIPVNAQIYNFDDDLIIVSESAFEPVIPRFVDDFAYLISAPSRITDKNIAFLAGLTTITAGVMIGVDTPVYNGFSKNHPSSYNLMAAPGRFYDRVDPDLFLLGSSGLMIGSGYRFNDNKLAKTGWTALEAVLFTELATSVVKSTLGRRRPFLDKGNADFEIGDFVTESTSLSFPSGHTSKIFALSTVVASSYDSPWVRIPAYALAGSVALQRVESSDHWVSDVIVGGAIGYFMGRALATQNGLVGKNANITPVVKGGLVGLNIQF